MRKLFIFDLGKVLVHGLDTTAGLGEIMGFDPVAFRRDYRAYERALMDGWVREEDYYAHLEMKFGKSVAQALSSPQTHLVPDDGLLEAVCRLREKGNVCVIGSNTIASHWAATPERVIKCFDRVYPSFAIHRSKPEACFFSYICGEEGFSYEDTLFIDDREENIRTAEDLGITCLLYKGADLEKRSQAFLKPYL